MSIQDTIVLGVAILILVAVPVAMIWTIVDHVRNSHKRERRGTGGGGALGGAMLELDRLIRPSSEHTIEAQNQVLRREDDQGGE